jgi:hypothetical protein
MQARKKAPQHVKNDALAAASITVRSPEIGEPTLTVGQIVRQLEPLASDAATMSERIRHWTRLGLLLPVTQHHAGTGKHRGYHDSSGFVVTVLNTLADAGLQVASRPYIQVAMVKTRQALQKWQQARNAGRKLPLLFLVIVHEKTHKGSEPSVWLREGNPNNHPTGELAIVINLSELFSQVRPGT